MGRCDHRGGGWRRTLATRSLALVLAAGALFTGGDAVRAQEIALAVPDAPGPGRRAGTGPERLDVEMRRRLDDEERRVREVLEDSRERELLLLFRECSQLPHEDVRLGPDDLSTPSSVFLRAVTPAELDDAPIERRGFDRWVAREVRREWRRQFGQDLDRRRLERETPFARVDVDAEAEEFLRRLDESGEVGRSRTFPEYWEAHPRATPPPPRVEGERIELFRLGALTLVNDMTLRCDVRSLLGDDRPAPEADGAGSRASAASASRARIPASPRAVRLPHGNLYSGENTCLDGQVRLSSGTAALDTAFLRAIRADVEWTLFSRQEGTRLLAVELQAEYQPGDNETSVALMVELLRF